MISLRGRLLAILIVSTGVVWCSGFAWIYFGSRSEVQHLLDRRLMEAARMVMSLTRQPGALGNLDLAQPDGYESLPVPVRYEHRLSCQIWSFDGRLVGRSSNAPSTQFTPGSTGFSEPVVDGVTYRVFAMEDPVKGVRVLVGDNLQQRATIIDDLLRGLLLPAAVMFPLLAALIWISVRRGLRPLDRVTETLTTRGAENLTPVDVGHTPAEIRPLMTALNSLFERVVVAREHERSFVAYAAHELRTPLAGIKMQAQIASAATDEPTRRGALDRTLKGVDRTARLIRQLLAISKLDAGPSHPAEQWIDLEGSLEQLRGYIGREFRAERIVLAARVAGREIAFDRELFDLALGNLLENALQYAPLDGTVLMSLEINGTLATLSVEDDGPGIPDAERELVLDRFYRGRNRSPTGSGLGLPIAISALERAGARLQLLWSEDFGGLKASIEFDMQRVRLKTHPTPDCGSEQALSQAVASLG